MHRPLNLGVRKIERVHSGDPSSYFKFDCRKRHGNSRYSFIDAERVPAFEGDAALAEIERVYSNPWGHYRVIRIVEVLDVRERPPESDRV